MKLKNENMDNNLGEKKKLLDIIDSLYLNRISDKELTNIIKLTNGGQSKVKIGNYYDMKVIIKVLHNLNVRDYTTEVIHSYKYRHPSIPKFLGVYESFKEIGLVFEYAEGQTLNKLISNERNGKFHMPLLIKIDYLLQLANVIEFLHDNHLIHRDLKTDNVVIDYLGNLYLLDFGIAIPDTKNYIDMNSNDYSLTPNYIPPEIVRQAVSLGNEEDNSCPDLELIKITNKYDIWTFGVIMAELFTRCPPWCNKEKGVKPDEFQIRSLILKHVEYPIPKIYPESDYDQMIRHVVRKCLIYDENERLNIKEIKKELNIILNCEMIKTNKNIKFDALKELNEIKNEIKDSGKGNFKNNKILGKKICIKEINDLNMRLNCNNKFNIHESNSSEFSLILSDYIKNKCSSYFSSTNTENSITDGLKKLILYKNQKLKILQHKKREMQMKVQELTNKSQIYENLSTTIVEFLGLEPRSISFS